MTKPGDKKNAPKQLRIANGPDVDTLLTRAGHDTEVTVPASVSEDEELVSPPDSHMGEPSRDGGQALGKNARAQKAASVVSVLEKMASRPDDEQLKRVAESQLSGLDLSPFEASMARKLGILPGLSDPSDFALSNFVSKKLLAFALKTQPSLLSVEDLVTVTLDAKLKTSHTAARKALTRIKESEPLLVDAAVTETLFTAAESLDERLVAAWLAETVLPMKVVLAPNDGARLLSLVYNKMLQSKAVSTSLRELAVQAICLIGSPQNLVHLDDAVSGVSGMGPASFATILHETRRMEFVAGSPRHSLVMSLLRPRERKTASFLAQVGVLKDFDLDGLGLLSDNAEAFTHISTNQSVIDAVKDECRRRLKSEKLPDVHYWLLKYPNLRAWISDKMILERLRPQDDFLSGLFFDEGRKSGEDQAIERAQESTAQLKSDLERSESLVVNLEKDLREVRERHAELEQRFRSVATSAQSASKDQVRQGQIDAIKLLIELMNAIEISTGLSDGVRSTLQAVRAKLSGFGVEWRYEIGSVVSFLSRDHLATDLKEGSAVKILTPCYYLANSASQIALVKARVIPA